MAATLLRVGLTGNIAAGKSTVAARLEELGCLVVDADELAHDCLRPGHACHDRVVGAFGDGILRADGTIDRSALGRVVFADDEARSRLEAILHPAIRDREGELFAAASAGRQSAIAVTEAALLYETGSAARYHRMVVVTAPDDVRLRRLVGRGLTTSEASQRMTSQMDQYRKAALADYVIVNAETLDDAATATTALFTRLRGDLDHVHAGRALPPVEPPR